MHVFTFVLGQVGHLADVEDHIPVLGAGVDVEDLGLWYQALLLLFLAHSVPLAQPRAPVV
jgi:hypothetical protein